MGDLPPRVHLPTCPPHRGQFFKWGMEVSNFQFRADGLAEPEFLPWLMTTGLYKRKMKSKKSTQQSVPADSEVGARGSAEGGCSPPQGGWFLASSLSPKRPARGQEMGLQAGGDPECRSPPPAPGEDPRGAAPRRSCAPEPLRGDAGPKESPLQSAPTWRRRAGRSAPSPAGGAPRASGTAPPPGTASPPAASPLAAASSAAAIAGATRPALQSQGWQHGEPRARPAPAQAAARGTRGALPGATAAPGRAASAASPPGRPGY